MQTTWLHYIVDIIKQACENIWYYLHVVIIINNYYRKVSTKKTVQLTSFLMLLAIQEMAHFLVSVIVLTIIPLLQHVIKLKFSVVNLVHYFIILSTELPWIMC